MIAIPIILLGILGLISLVAVVLCLLNFFLWLNGDIVIRNMELIRQRNKEDKGNE